MKVVSTEQKKQIAELLDIPISFVDHLIDVRDDIEREGIDWNDVIVYIP